MSIFKGSAPGFSLVACATLMLPGFTGTANAAPGALIRNYQSGKCLDADANFLGYNGDRVQLWTCNGGANQKWLPIPDRRRSVAYRAQARDGRPTFPTQPAFTGLPRVPDLP